MNFKFHLRESALAKQELDRLQKWYNLLEVASDGSLKVMKFANCLTIDEAVFIYEAYQGGPSGNKDVVLFPQDWKKTKQRKFTPAELEYGSQQSRQAFQKYAEPRRAIVDVAKHLAQQSGKTWQEELDNVPLNVVFALLQQRNAVPPDTNKSYMMSQLKKMREDIKAGKTREFDPAMGVHLRKILKDQEPIIQAWKDLGFTSDYKDILDHLKEQGYEFPPVFIQQGNIDFIKGVRDKIKKGEALSPEEQKVYKTWMDLAKESPMRKTDDPFKAVGPDDVYHKIGNVLPPDEAELQLIKKTVYDIAYRKSHQEEEGANAETIARKFQRAAQRFARGEGKIKGMEQIAGTEEPTPEPYIAMDYHGTERRLNKKINDTYFDKFGNPNEKFYKDIVKPACWMTNKVVVLAMRRKGFEPGKMDIDPDDTKSFCGFDKDYNQKVDSLRADFLHGASMRDLVQTVILKMLNSTNLPKWDTEEGIRMRTAEVQAAKLVLDLLQKRSNAWKVNSMSKRDFEDKLRHDIQTKGQEEESAEEQLFDPETLQQIIDNPEALERMKDVVANAPPEQKDYYEKLLKAIEDKVAALK